MCFSLESPLVSRTLLSILADFNNAVVFWPELGNSFQNLKGFYAFHSVGPILVCTYIHLVVCQILIQSRLVLFSFCASLLRSFIM